MNSNFDRLPKEQLLVIREHLVNLILDLSSIIPTEFSDASFVQGQKYSLKTMIDEIEKIIQGDD